jgi:hypothetical protein
MGEAGERLALGLVERRHGALVVTADIDVMGPGQRPAVVAVEVMLHA